MAFDYDAFFSYSLDDLIAVEAIALRLSKDTGLRIFLDKWCLIPGEPWQDEIAKALDRSATCVVFIGPHGSSPWKHIEMRAALELRASQKMLRVIPVLLPGAKKVNPLALDLFLRAYTWIDYTEGVNNEKALELLKAGIYGYKPGPPEIIQNLDRDTDLGTLIADSLLPVTNFQNRPELDSIRSFWMNEKDSGVMAIVGIGGSGKTALICRFLQELPGSGLQNRAVPKKVDLLKPNGVFVWSFYDNPNVELFFQEFYRYLTKEVAINQPARDLTYRVIRFMETSHFRRVLLVLDGVEIVQEGHGTPGSFGILRDSSLRHFVRRIAQGDLGFRMLITSRYPFPDLLPFQESGYWLIEVDNLDLPAARSLLRSRGVKGTDAELNELVREYGNHALTLDHLGTLLHDFFKGNPSRARELPAMGVAEGDAYAEYQAYRLARVFSFYEGHLPSTELQVLRTLCVFRIPVQVSTVVAIFTDKHASSLSTLPKLDEITIQAILRHLGNRRLILFTGTANQITCTVHPAVRDYFYRAIRETGREIHNIVSQYLIPLADRPILERLPIELQDLDLLEELIYHTIRGGHVNDALLHYGMRMGGYPHLAWRLGEYQRGLRLASLLVEAGGISLESDIYNIRPWYDRSLFNLDLGHPDLAEDQLYQLQKHLTEPTDHNEIQHHAISGMRLDSKEIWLYYDAALLQSICDVLIAQGKFRDAEMLANQVITKGEENFWLKARSQKFGVIPNPFGRRATARFLQGKVSDALEDFHKADEFQKNHSERPSLREIAFGGYHVAQHAILLARLGKTRTARRLIRKCNSYQTQKNRPSLAAQYQLALAEIFCIEGKYAEAYPFVNSSLSWSVQTGHQETYVRAKLASSRIALYQEDFATAQSALTEVEQIARNCGYSTWLIDALILAGHFAMITKRFEQARQYATEALEISTKAQNNYAWGKGSAAHLLAEIEFEEGNFSAALSNANYALEVRNIIHDSRLNNTERLLVKIRQKLD